MPFMLEIIQRCDNETDTFALEMLSKRIVLERNAVNVETDRAIREQAERNAGHQEVKERTSDD